MFFKSKESRQNERKKELEEFLRSAGGRRVMFELAPDILVSSKLTPIIDHIKVQMEALSHHQVERFTVFLEATLKAAENRLSANFDQFKEDLAKTLEAVEVHIFDFLSSQQGRQLMLDLLIEALAKGELKPVLCGAQERLKTLAEELAATHAAHTELSLQQSAEAHAAALKRSSSEAARNFASEIAHDVQQQLKSYRGEIVEVVREQLPVALREEVARHVGSGPLFSPPCSNRALAAAHGISIREVKRRRQNGWL
jgi:uncharacterized protein YjgD (DUF1641 family)